MRSLLLKSNNNFLKLYKKLLKFKKIHRNFNLLLKLLSSHQKLKSLNKSLFIFLTVLR